MERHMEEGNTQSPKQGDPSSAFSVGAAAGDSEGDPQAAELRLLEQLKARLTRLLAYTTPAERSPRGILVYQDSEMLPSHMFASPEAELRHLELAHARVAGRIRRISTQVRAREAAAQQQMQQQQSQSSGGSVFEERRLEVREALYDRCLQQLRQQLEQRRAEAEAARQATLAEARARQLATEARLQAERDAVLEYVRPVAEEEALERCMSEYDERASFCTVRYEYLQALALLQERCPRLAPYVNPHALWLKQHKPPEPEDVEAPPIVLPGRTEGPDCDPKFLVRLRPPPNVTDITDYFYSPWLESGLSMAFGVPLS